MWHDRRIGAGEDWENEISENLEKADIILLLVSSDFIASPYCYGVEMTRALQRHQNGEAWVIPVILRPCLWQGLLFGRLQATPTDGQPVTKFPSQDEAFLQVTKAIQEAVKKFGTAKESIKNQRDVSESDVVAASAQPSQRQDIRSSNLRVKKQFTDHEKDQYRDEALEYIANYFENSLDELKKRNPEVDSRFRRIDSNHFTATAYINGERVSGCKVWIGDRFFTGSIAFSFNESRNDSSMNETLSAEDDCYTLFLKPMGLAMRGKGSNERLTYQGGAEYFWSLFIEPLQR